MRIAPGMVLATCMLVASSGIVMAQVDTAWIRDYNSGGSASDNGSGLFMDANGFLYLVGTINITPQGNGTLAMWKYDPDGNLVWVNSYGVIIDARADRIYSAIDVESNLIVGVSKPNGVSDYFILKANSDGDTVWTRQYDGVGGGGDVLQDLEVGADGSVVVTGYSYGVTPGPFFTLTDVATLKYSAAGDLLWERRSNGWSNMRVFDLAIDADENVVWSGLIDTTTEGMSPVAIVTKYAAHGDGLWAVYLDSVEDPVSSFLAIDDENTIYVFSGLWNGYPSQGGTLHDLALMRIDESGTLDWLRRYDGMLHADEFAVDLALTPGGYPIVLSLALEVADSGLDMQTMLYDATGQLQWVRRYGEINGSSKDDGATDLTIGQDSLIIAIGTSPVNDIVTRCLTAAGELLWQQGFNPSVGSAYPYRAVRDAPHTYVSGRVTGGPTSSDLLTIKYSPCCCACLADPICDGVQSDITDVVRAIEGAFRGGVYTALDCEYTPTDVDCSGVTDVGDVVHVINVAFRAYEASSEYCQ